jgi:dihydrofolate reductase
MSQLEARPEQPSEGVTMRKIIVGAQVSIDGVMQAPGGRREDPTSGFTFGGWSMPYFDQVFGEEIDRLFEEKFDLLLGRKTYEIFAAYWPYYDEAAAHGGIARLFKEIRKYVVSRSGDVETSWQGSRVSGTGLTIAHYERGGEVKVSDTADDEPSEAEVARQARMKREG